MSKKTFNYLYDDKNFLLSLLASTLVVYIMLFVDLTKAFILSLSGDKSKYFDLRYLAIVLGILSIFLIGGARHYLRLRKAEDELDKANNKR